MKTFLHVGCNRKYKDKTTKAFNTSEWNECRLDIDAAVNPDIVASMLDLSCIQDETYDAVYSSHNIEHLHPHEVPVALGEFRRVLKPDGFLVITCPDLQEICKIIGEGNLVQPVYNSPAGPIAPIDILFGHRKSIAQGNIFMAHKCGFIIDVLLQSLKLAGFAGTAGYRRFHPHFDLWAVAGKGQLAEADYKKLLDIHRPV